MKRLVAIAAIIGALMVLAPAAGATGTAPLTFPQTNGVVLDGTMVQQVLYIGGNFTSVTEPSGRVVAAKNLAAIDTTTNKVVYAGNANSYVRAIAAVSGKVYIGGSFTTVNGVARPHVAQLEAATHALTGWKPATDRGVVSALAVAPDAIYFGTGSRVVAVRPDNAAVIWSLPVTGGGVRALLLSPPSNGPPGLYVGGLFETVGGLAEHGLMVVYPALSGTPLASFHPNLKPDSTALSSTWDGEEVLRLDWDSSQGLRLVAGIGGGFKNEVRSFEPTQGGTWWMTQTEGDVQGMAVAGSTVYAGWHRNHGNQLGIDYDIFGGSFSAATGALLPWRPRLTGDLSDNAAGDNGGVQDIVVTDTRVYFLGDFTTYGATCTFNPAVSHGYSCTGGTPRKGIAVYSR